MTWGFRSFNPMSALGNPERWGSREDFELNGQISAEICHFVSDHLGSEVCDTFSSFTDANSIVPYMAKKKVFTLSQRQKRLLNALKELRELRDNAMPTNMRVIAAKYEVLYISLQRVSKKQANESTILQQSDGKGRKARLTNEEEKIIADALLEFQNRGTPLDRQCLLYLAHTLIETLPEHRRKLLGFRDDRPGKAWINSFLSRDPVLTLQRRVSLESDRAAAMNPEMWPHTLHACEHCVINTI